MRYTIILIALLQPLFALSQESAESRKDKIESLRIAYITKELSLSTNEAQQFWPVYNQFQEELKVIRKNRKLDIMEAKINFDSMTDVEIAKMIDGDFQFQQLELDLRKKYVEEYKKVLPVRKVAKLLRAEHTFKIELLREFRNRQGEGPPQPHGK
ncbi:MAG: hypothetical protein KJS45_03250 [Bacteroidetes bacterium]|jgi:hypothetical protein|nr:hypothetical protein [Bacteroidota bacterium]